MRGHARARDGAPGQTDNPDAAFDAERLAVLKRSLESLEERERLLVRLRQDHDRAGADLERRLSTPFTSGAEAGRRSSLRKDMRAFSDAVSDGVQARLSGLEAERQDLFSRMSEEGMREGRWVRGPLNPRIGMTLQGRGTSRRLWETPWRMARHAPPALAPREVVGCAGYLKARLLFDLKFLLACLSVALVGAAGAHALAESPPHTALGFFFGEYVFPFVARSASVVLLTHLLITFPTSLYGFFRPGAFMRRRARHSKRPAPEPGRRRDPSARGGPRDDVVLNDDPE